MNNQDKEGYYVFEINLCNSFSISSVEIVVRYIYAVSCVFLISAKDESGFMYGFGSVI